MVDRLQNSLAHFWESTLVLQAVETIEKKKNNAEVRRPFCIGSAFLGKRASDRSNPAEEIWFLEFFVNARLIFHCSNDSIMHRGVGDPKHLN